MVVCFCSIDFSYAQLTDTTLQKPPKAKLPEIQHSPKKAALMSAILPGAGQVYNKKYWKLPVIYAGAAGLGYAFTMNEKKFVQYKTAYIARIDGDPNTVDNYPRYSDDNLNTLMKFYERYRNLSVIGFTVLYALNIIDASVDAHMFTFNVADDDLTFHVQPMLINTGYSYQQTYSAGLSLGITFR